MVAHKSSGFGSYCFPQKSFEMLSGSATHGCGSSFLSSRREVKVAETSGVEDR